MKRIRPILFVAFALAVGLAAGVPDAEAHRGQLSKKDDCHKMKAANERHWHIPGTGDRGGPCVKSDAGTVKVLDPAPDDLAPELELAKAELAKANDYIRGCREAVREAVTAPRDWLNQVELDAEGRRALARPCLEP